MRKLLPVLVLVCSACATSGVQVARHTAEVYPPTHNVEVVVTLPPAGTYVSLAGLSVVAGSDAVLEMAERAKGLGADAIVLQPSASGGAVTTPVGFGVYATQQITWSCALAIRYNSSEGRAGPPPEVTAAPVKARSGFNPYNP